MFWASNTYDKNPFFSEEDIHLVDTQFEKMKIGLTMTYIEFKNILYTQFILRKINTPDEKPYLL